jgi:hypothetical protein
MRWKDGSQYSGFWKNDLMNGKGTMTYTNGSVYEGEWIEGRKNGFGKLTQNGTLISEGLWQNDNFSGGSNPVLAPQNFNQSSQSTTTSSSTQVRREKHKNVTIIGNEDFIKQIKDALALLEYKAPEECAIVTDYVLEIKQHERSGMRVEKKCIELADRTTFYSLEWCASVLVHEANHSKIYTEHKKKNPYSPVAYEVYGGAKAERICNLLQAKTGEKIGLNKSDIDYLLKGDGKHGDIDGDGDVDEDDYKLRDW